MKPIKKQFNEKEFKIVVSKGRELFVAKDTCDMLNIQNVSQALNEISNKHKAVISLTYTSSNGVEL